MLSPSTPDPHTTPLRRAGLPWRLARAGVLLVLLAFSLALVAWLTLHWGILPRVEQWRPAIEKQASQALGQPVRIGSIAVHSSGWVPAFDLRDVQVLDAAGRPALTLAAVRVALAPASLVALELRLAQLHVDGVQLDVRRDVQGRIHVAGMDLQAGTAGADDGAAADWLFSQQEIVVRQGVLRWTDELRGAPPLELQGVDLVLRNGLRRHEIRIDGTPPPAWGERFSLRGRFTQSLFARAGDWRRWSGTLYGDLPAVDVIELRRQVSLPFDLDQGRGSARVWLDWRGGQWRELTADVALADVSLRMGSELQPLALTQVQARLYAKRDAAGLEFAAQKLAFTTGEGVVWPAGDLLLSLQQVQDLRAGLAPVAAPQATSAASVASAAAPPAAPDAPVTGGRLQASRLDLALMASIASRLPIGEAGRKALADLAPAGVATALDVSWKGPLDAPDSYRAKGRIERLALSPLPAASAPAVGRPGLAGADIDFEANEAAGTARLAMNGGALYFPGVFEQPSIPFDKLAAKLDWRVQRQAAGPPALELKVTEAQFSNADAQGDLRATWRTGKTPGFGLGARFPGEIDLTGRIVKARAQRAAAYLPMGIPAVARHYVGRAIKSGTLESGSLAIKGDIWRFPFHSERDGIFRFAAKLRDVQFDYLPSVAPGGDEAAWESPWPGLSNVQGDLLVDRMSLQIDAAQAGLWGVQLRNFKARIDDLSASPVLQLGGDARGPVADLLRFVDVTPVGRSMGGGLEPLTATGIADMKLALAIPLNDSARTTVNGSITLAGNDVRVRPGTPLLAGARGRVDFTQRGFNIVGASARVLGGEASFEGGLQPDGSLRFTGQGVATADGLRRAAELAPLPAVAAQLRGQTSYRLTLGIVQGWSEVSVSSDLVGLESDWPAPLNKAATTAWPTRWQNSLVAASLAAGEKPRDTLRLDIGTVLQARLVRDLSGEASRIVSGGVGLFEAAPTPASAGGVELRGTLATIDADAWFRVWQRLPDSATAGSGLPRSSLQLRADTLTIGERRVTAAVVDLQHEPQAAGSNQASWQGQVQADQLAGRVSWRAPRDGLDPGRLSARLTRLALPPSETVDVEQLLDRAPSRMPALDVVIDDFEYRGRKLGRVEVQALSRPSATRPGAREWRMDKLDILVPEAHLQASGIWAPTPVAGGPRRMSLDFGIDLADSGKLAGRFGWPDAVRGGKGRMQGKLAWDGSPMAPDAASMDGQLNVALEAGQFLRAEPGIGRVLGILSLQSLPRRLLLDFRDVFQEGFAFDSVQGDVALARGRAKTDNLRMRGVQAVVAMEGTADLVRETQDLRVAIVPEINAGAASLAYAAINPAVALGTFVAQLVLREPLRAAGTREFHITGPLAEPKVERVERTAGAVPAAVPAAADPPKKEPPG